MKYPYVTIKDSILKWAIQESDIDNGTIYSRFPKLDDWISGKEQPTMKQLSDFSLMTHIPLGYFFLDNPPTESVGLLKYRTFNSVHNQKPSKNLLDTIFEMEMRQDWMREFLISNLEEKKYLCFFIKDYLYH
ncbi:MAG: hypothetical protein LBU12_08525 [Deltaproteobacteria bacterium]|jgi:hypothetical protein|nr:hypothetical protein [Deltaproteobacteria bacterium]